MKAPFRQQASSYDCTPTSLVNALCYLFKRKEIPPFIIHQIYRECLDIESARGTSDRAVEDIALLLRNYKEKGYNGFNIKAKMIHEDQVHFGKDSQIIKWLNSDGVAMLTVSSYSNKWHSILACQICDDWLYCYDPAPRTKRFINNEAVQFLPTTKLHDPNLKIRLGWIDRTFSDAKTQEERKFILGCTEYRECLLLNRINRRFSSLKKTHSSKDCQ